MGNSQTSYPRNPAIYDAMMAKEAAKPKRPPPPSCQPPIRINKKDSLYRRENLVMPFGIPRVSLKPIQKSVSDHLGRLPGTYLYSSKTTYLGGTVSDGELDALDSSGTLVENLENSFNGSLLSEHQSLSNRYNKNTPSLYSAPARSGHRRMHSTVSTVSSLKRKNRPAPQPPKSMPVTPLVSRRPHGAGILRKQSQRSVYSNTSSERALGPKKRRAPAPPRPTFHPQNGAISDGSEGEPDFATHTLDVEVHLQGRYHKISIPPADYDGGVETIVETSMETVLAEPNKVTMETTPVEPKKQPIAIPTKTPTRKPPPRMNSLLQNDIKAVAMTRGGKLGLKVKTLDKPKTVEEVFKSDLARAFTEREQRRETGSLQQKVKTSVPIDQEVSVRYLADHDPSKVNVAPEVSPDQLIDHRSEGSGASNPTPPAIHKSSVTSQSITSSSLESWIPEDDLSDPDETDHRVVITRRTEMKDPNFNNVVIIRQNDQIPGMKLAGGEPVKHKKNKSEKKHKFGTGSLRRIRQSVQSAIGSISRSATKIQKRMSVENVFKKSDKSSYSLSRESDGSQSEDEHDGEINMQWKFLDIDLSDRDLDASKSDKKAVFAYSQKGQLIMLPDYELIDSKENDKRRRGDKPKLRSKSDSMIADSDLIWHAKQREKEREQEIRRLKKVEKKYMQIRHHKKSGSLESAEDSETDEELENEKGDSLNTSVTRDTMSEGEMVGTITFNESGSDLNGEAVVKKPSKKQKRKSHKDNGIRLKVDKNDDSCSVRIESSNKHKPKFDSTKSNPLYDSDCEDEDDTMSKSKEATQASPQYTKQPMQSLPAPKTVRNTAQTNVQYTLPNLIPPTGLPAPYGYHPYVMPGQVHQPLYPMIQPQIMMPPLLQPAVMPFYNPHTSSSNMWGDFMQMSLGGTWPTQASHLTKAPASEVSPSISTDISLPPIGLNREVDGQSDSNSNPMQSTIQQSSDKVGETAFEHSEKSTTDRGIIEKRDSLNNNAIITPTAIHADNTKYMCATEQQDDNANEVTTTGQITAGPVAEKFEDTDPVTEEELTLTLQLFDDVSKEAQPEGAEDDTVHDERNPPFLEHLAIKNQIKLLSARGYKPMQFRPMNVRKTELVGAN